MFLSYLVPTSKISQSYRIFRLVEKFGEKFWLNFWFRVQSPQPTANFLNRSRKSWRSRKNRRRTPRKPCQSSRARRSSTSLLCLLHHLLTSISFLQLKWSSKDQKRSKRNLKRSMKLTNILGNHQWFIRAISQIKEKILTLWRGRVRLLRKDHRGKLKTINRENQQKLRLKFRQNPRNQQHCQRGSHENSLKRRPGCHSQRHGGPRSQGAESRGEKAMIFVQSVITERAESEVRAATNIWNLLKVKYFHFVNFLWRRRLEY